MKPVYIHSATCISAQLTFNSENPISEFCEVTGKKVEAVHPNYKEYISPIALRRMATGVKMGVAAANKALKNAGIEHPDAILTGTGMGCIEDTEKFLDAIIVNEEEFLTPTAFIQSTHNTVGAQIALGLKCKAYNNTYVHGGLSFESALLDANMLLHQDEANHVLVGGVDELGTEFVDLVRMMEDKSADGIKVPISEGAAFFALSSEVKKNSIQLLDIECFSSIPKDAVNDNLHNFLIENRISVSDIDIVMVGSNGDIFDEYYEKVTSVFSKNTPFLKYKNLCGEFYTASAFGLFLAYGILKSQHIPKVLDQNQSEKPLDTILLYNQFKGRDHSFILLKRC